MSDSSSSNGFPDIYHILAGLLLVIAVISESLVPITLGLFGPVTIRPLEFYFWFFVGLFCLVAGVVILEFDHHVISSQGPTNVDRSVLDLSNGGVHTSELIGSGSMSILPSHSPNGWAKARTGLIAEITFRARCADCNQKTVYRFFPAGQRQFLAWRHCAKHLRPLERSLVRAFYTQT